MSSMDYDARRLLCRMVGGLIAADIDVEDSEREFLDKLMVELEIPESEWDSLFPLMEPDEAREQLSELDPDEGEEMFGILIRAAAVDGEVSEEEVDFLRVVGAALAIDEATLKSRLDEALDGD